MSFKSEAIINLKDLIQEELFDMANAIYSIHDVDTYGGHLSLEYVFDIDAINDDITCYKEEYPLFKEEEISEIIEDNCHISDETRKEMGEEIRISLLPSGTKEALAKYGIKLVDTEYYTPQCYNYTTDRLDIHLEDIEPGCGDVSPEIYILMEKFINSAPKSRDGYINLLPNSVDECKRLDIPHIFAILYKEGILEDVIDNVEHFIERCTEIMRSNAYIEINKKMSEEYKKILWNTSATIKK